MIHATMQMASRQQRVGRQDLSKREGQNADPMDNAPVDLADGLLTCAIKDARQSQDRALQQEALAWLWICCPDVADDLRLPALAATEIQSDVTGYFRRYAAFSFS
ncbi:MAG: hypothetical protein NT075_02010 [Chloroflexi bacterium]|nr:hypothetical protein [Chloroflexota bacterium]